MRKRPHKRDVVELNSDAFVEESEVLKAARPFLVARCVGGNEVEIVSLVCAERMTIAVEHVPALTALLEASVRAP